ncbi:glycerol-3-phosphate responsive antiterminator [Arthrobacter castelli]|uniref:glycerol-3-phosphate responsive antiterminator n=1 Tax=Arthrobacter castelli TaxID=271431 RepID=UPI00040E3A65|nr:glycerol-3-phosphate responsive antiterminator [Arthrobacter castelli]
MSNQSTAGAGPAEFLELLREDPIIATVKEEAGLREILDSERQVVFLLFGSILSIEETVARCKTAAKTVLVNVDMVDGLSGRDVSIDWLASHTQVDGILSTKTSLIRAARRNGLVTVQRFFLVDSLSYGQLPRVASQAQPDVLEILPGCVPRVLTWLREDTDIPLIAGGLVCEKDDVVAALGAGALAVASSNRDVWTM